MMKKIITFLAAIGLTAGIFAQAPNKMSYQAVVRNADGVLVQSSNVGIKISLLQGASDEKEVYTETHNIVTNINGLATLEIGGGKVVSGNFAAIDWSAGPYFLKTETDPKGGTNYTITGTSELLSVPFALYSKTARTADYNDLVNLPILFDGTWTSLTGKPTGNTQGDMQYWNGTTWIMIPVGVPGQFLRLSTSNIPEWSGKAYPLLTTISVSSVGSSTAISGGNISSDGGDPVTSRGVCWSTSANPTIVNSKTTDGTGIGGFMSFVTGLVQNTAYYIRAYATNNIGTGYGNEFVIRTEPSTVSIGNTYQGGIVAYILQPEDPGYRAGQTHGLIVAPSDQSDPITGIQWYNGSYTTTGATATALGSGNANTTAIVSSQGEGSYAAKLCYDLVLGGYSDWYMPSMDELNKLYLNRVALGMNLEYAYNWTYWSSSEYSGRDSMFQDFSNLYGGQGNYNKSEKLYVRAVRSF